MSKAWLTASTFITLSDIKQIAENAVVTAGVNGLLAVGGNIASGVADAGNPLKIGGRYNATLPTLTDGQRGDTQLGTRGSTNVQVKNADGTSNQFPSAVVLADGAAINPTTPTIGVIQYGQITTTTGDRLRTPNVFKYFSATVVTNETAIWTPTSGKKFRLMGFVISQGAATGDITVRDGTGLTTILVIPATPVGQPLAFAMGNGILSGAANRVLTMQGSSLETVSGFVYGTEE